MKIGLICPDVPGHLNPLTTLGSELKRRGHWVTLIGGEMSRPIVERAALDFHLLGKNDELADQAEREWKRLGECSGFQSMIQTGKILGLKTRLVLDHLPQAIRDLSIDGLIIDQVSPAGCIIAERVSIPFVIACNALAAFWDPIVPPPPLPWGYRTDVIGRIRNQFAKHLITPIYNWAAEKRKTGIDPLMLIFDADHGLAQIAQQPNFFDFPRSKPLPRLHYTGPWHQPDRDDTSIDFPWEWLDERPLIYASMGTLQNRLTHIFQMIVEAVGDLPMQCVLSKGGGNVQVEGTIPDNVLLVDRAPQLRLLEKASLAITHAGLNTALECLAHGVPMLCLPVTNDQPGVAKRVEWLRAGRVIPVQKVTTNRLMSELKQLTDDCSYQDVANDLQSRIARVDGVSVAADIVEQALSTKTTVECDSTIA